MGGARKFRRQQARNASGKQPVYDWDAGDLVGPLPEGYKAPRGWGVFTVTRADMPEGYKADVYVCRCGCGRTYRVGERYAIRRAGIRVTGFAEKFRLKHHITLKGWDSHILPPSGPRSGRSGGPL